MAESSSGAGRYAVMLRTHLWDGFVARQYRRLAAQIGEGGDLYVLVDETSGPVAVTEGRVVSHSQQGLKALGLADTGTGNMLWYNGDYPLYAFYKAQPGYDFYAMVEYDVAVNVPFDEVIGRMRREGIGFVGLSKGEAVADWPFTATCLGAYALEAVKKRLICATVLSRAALEALFERRLALSRDYAEGRLDRWPYCEGFMPTELALRGFKLAELSEFGSTALYDWTPAFAEEDLPTLRSHAFIHPVLDAPRYVQATMKRNWRTVDVLDPGSDIMRRLRRVPLRDYGPPLATAVRRRVLNAARKRLGRHAAG